MKKETNINKLVDLPTIDCPLRCLALFFSPFFSLSLSLGAGCRYGLLLSPDVADPLDSNLALSFYESSGIYEIRIVNHCQKCVFQADAPWSLMHHTYIS
jgi:hypothetical protein